MGRPREPPRVRQLPSRPSRAAAQTLADAFGKLANDINGAINDANTEFTNLTGAAGPIKSGRHQPRRSSTRPIDAAIDAGQSPNDLLDRRDQILDDLSQYGQVSVTPAGQRPHPGHARQPVGRQRPDRRLADAPAAAGFNPGGGQLGALSTLATDRSLPGYLAVARRRRQDARTTTSTRAYGATFFGGDTAATLGTGIAAAVDDHRRHGHRRGRPTTSRTPSPPCATRAPRPASTARSCARSAPTPRTRTNAQAIAQSAVDAAEDRRQNVSGVSLDEEMANMLRFQRGYQASARAMSTIDDMLDTLINRAGRVGL